MRTTGTRAHARIPLEIEIDLESENNFYSGLSADISEGGIFVATYMLPQLGEELEMMLRLPGEPEAFKVTGVVRWVRDLRVPCEGASSGFGMQWNEIPKEALSAIQRLVSLRDTLFFESFAEAA